jgi:hypothetical protein
MLIREFIEYQPVEIHKELNPKIWDEKRRLRPEIRSQLLKIATDFVDFVEVPFRIVDIVIAGSNASLTYTKHSDLDLHIIADYSSLGPCDREADELFDTKRHLYKKDYKIEIRGIPVELYIEDSNLPAVSNVYSVEKNQWIKEPSISIPEYDQEEVERWATIWKKLVTLSIKKKNLEVCRQVMKLLRQYRTQGLKTLAGEFSVPNLVYKSLRNQGVLEKLSELIDTLHSNSLSLK